MIILKSESYGFVIQYSNISLLYLYPDVQILTQERISRIAAIKHKAVPSLIETERGRERGNPKSGILPLQLCILWLARYVRSDEHVKTKDVDTLEQIWTF